MAKEPKIGAVAEKLISSVQEALEIAELANEGLESKALKNITRLLKGAVKAGDKLIGIAESLLEELAQAEEEEEDEDEEDDDWDEDEDDED